MMDIFKEIKKKNIVIVSNMENYRKIIFYYALVKYNNLILSFDEDNYNQFKDYLDNYEIIFLRNLTEYETICFLKKIFNNFIIEKDFFETIVHLSYSLFVKDCNPENSLNIINNLIKLYNFNFGKKRNIEKYLDILNIKDKIVKVCDHICDNIFISGKIYLYNGSINFIESNYFKSKKIFYIRKNFNIDLFFKRIKLYPDAIFICSCVKTDFLNFVYSGIIDQLVFYLGDYYNFSNLTFFLKNNCKKNFFSITDNFFK